MRINISRPMTIGRPVSLAMRQAVQMLCLLVFLFASGCGSQNQAGTPTAQQASSTAARPTAAPLTQAATSGPAATTPGAAPVPEGSFQNPVLKSDFPDPAVLQVGPTYYAYATNASGKNIQAARSTDLVHWELLPDAMPGLPAWARPGGSLVWAPEVIQIGDQYLLYYTARDKQSNKQCVGVATSTRPEGKFKDTRDQALVCQAQEGGTIDPSPFRDGVRLYLYFKNDGNCCGFPTYLYVQELAPDGLSLVGEPTRLVRNDAPWEGRVVEAPTMIKHDNVYYLFFSGNNYAGFEYAVGYATCASAIGPCEDSPDNPILASRMQQKPLVIGPGHQTVVQAGDQTWLVYHVWELLSSGVRGSRRFMWIDQITWKDGKPDVHGPTTDPQPMPRG